MPRQPRIDGPGLIYHVMARGIDGKPIFVDDCDGQMFLDRLGAVLTDTNTPIYAFCLLPNHLHLLMRRGRHQIATIMRRLLTGYALYFNKRHHQAGHLFQNRYKAVICQEDPYLLELVRYINLNPIRAKLVETIDSLGDFSFSSHMYVVRRKVAPWFDTKAVLCQFSGNIRAAKSIYLDFLEDGLAQKPNLESRGPQGSYGLTNFPRSAKALDERILGDVGFVENLLFTEEKEVEGEVSFDMSAVADLVCQKFEISFCEIVGKSKRVPVAKARAVLVIRLVKEAGLSGKQIASELNMTQSQVSKIITKNRL